MSHLGAAALISPFPGGIDTRSCHANDLDCSKGREAVHQNEENLDFGGTSDCITCADAFTK